MGLYRKKDLAGILASLSPRLGDKFMCSPDSVAALGDIFYVEENKIEVDGETESGYCIIIYFENGVSLTPYWFTTLNSLSHPYRSYKAITEKKDSL
jgi:hypothetical protein